MPVTITPAPKPTKPQLTYPVLMQWREDSPTAKPLVVLFITESSGSSLTSGGFSKVQTHWEPVTSDNWIPFKGTLTFTD